MADELPGKFRVGEIEVDRDLNQICLAGQCHQVEPKVMEVLYYLACRPDQVIPRQELMDALWPSTVSDGAVSRVLGLLRKALGDSAASPRYIQTVAKKGYRLIAQVEALPPVARETGEIAQAPNPSPGRPLGVAAMALLVLCLLVVVGWWGLTPADAEGELEADEMLPTAYTAPSFVQLTSEQGFEYDATLSEDEQWLLYRHRKTVSDPYRLYLKILDTQQVIPLTASEDNDRAPTFARDKLRIVFFRKGRGRCRLMMLELDAAGQPLRERLLYECGAVQHYSNVAWSADNRLLYFTDRASKNVPYQIYSLDLATGRVDEITDSRDNYYGDNELAVSPSGRYLAFFRNKYWGNNQVYILDLQTGEERKIRELGFLAWNISWSRDEDYLLYSDNRAGGRLNRLELASGEVTSLYRSPLAIHAPELSASGRGIVYATATANVDLWQLSLEGLAADIQGKEAPGNELPVSKLPGNSSRLDMQPALGPRGDKLLFLSDRSGSIRLWLRDGERLSVIDGLPETLSIDDYRWRPDGRQAVVSTSDKRLYLVDIEKRQASLLALNGQSAAFGEFAADGHRLYFTSDSTGDWQLWSLELASLTATPLTTGGGYRARRSPDGRSLYFTKYRQDGIWQLDLATGQEGRIVDALPRWTKFALCDSALLYADESQDIALWRQPLDDGPRRLLMSLTGDAELEFDIDSDCRRLVLSKWQNLGSDVQMLRL